LCMCGCAWEYVWGGVRVSGCGGALSTHCIFSVNLIPTNLGIPWARKLPAPLLLQAGPRQVDEPGGHVVVEARDGNGGAARLQERAQRLHKVHLCVCVCVCVCACVCARAQL